MEKIGNVCIDDSFYGGEDPEVFRQEDEELLALMEEFPDDEWETLPLHHPSYRCLYHFSHLRPNLVDWLPIGKEDHVLEVGCSGGALTGALAEKAGHVTAADPSLTACRINALRNRERTNLLLVPGNLPQFLDECEGKFDYIILADGLSEYAPCLPKLFDKLDVDGKLIAAARNRIGLKYWAGCAEEYTGRLFEGLEGYPQGERPHSYTKKELISLLEENGAGSVRIYYPYPDHLFTNTIYTGRYLPKKGEIQEFAHDYHHSRIALFSEPLVTDTLIDEKLYTEFVNSFLAVCQKRNRRQKDGASYVRFSNERDRRFSIRTEILEEKNRKVVRKTACYPEGKEHLLSIRKWEELLQRQYQTIPFQLNASRQEEDSLCLEYVQAESLAERLDALRLSGKTQEAGKLLLTFLERIRRSHQDRAFTWTPEFSGVFGGEREEYQVLSGLLCGNVTNIDLVCENLLLTEPEMVLDYEWTFCFPVPVDFVLYRVIHYFVCLGTGRSDFSEEELFSRAGIRPELIPCFEKMEEGFQNYIKGKHVPLREYIDRIVPGKSEIQVIPPEMEEEETEEEEKALQLQLFFSRGEEYQERDSVFLPFEQNCVKGRAEVPPGAKLLRMDPGENPCILEIRELSFDGKAASLEGAYARNGVLEGNWAYFAYGDPGVTGIRVPEGAKELSFDLVLHEDFETALSRLARRHSSAPENTEDYRAVVDICNYDANQGGVITLTGWCYTGMQEQKFQVRLGREELPFTVKRVMRRDVIEALPSLVFPDDNPGFELKIHGLSDYLEKGEDLRVRILAGEKSLPLLYKTAEELREEYNRDTIHYFIDALEKHRELFYARGWCLNLHGSVRLELQDENGKILKDAVWKRSFRSDLMDHFHIEEENCFGFQVEIKRNRIPGKKVSLVFANDLAEKREDVDLRSFDRENSRAGKMRALLSREHFEKNKELLQKAGPGGLWKYLEEEAANADELYEVYEKHCRPSRQELRRQERENFPRKPLFSIVVPLYRTPQKYLKELVDSVLAQSYGNWQLCLADGSPDREIEEYMKASYRRDKRIFYRHLSENKGISGNTNQALQMAKGDYIVFADHDDTLTPDALYENMRVLMRHPDAELIYSDEDLTDAEGRPYDPHFKPDYNPEYLCSINYICHLVVVKRSLLKKAGPLNAACDGAQDYDFILRCTEHTDKIFHIPKVLYHWRSHSGSTAGNEDNKMYAIEAGKRALEEHYRRQGRKASVEYTGHTVVFRSKFEVEGNPKISILIPSKDHTEDLKKCVESIMEKSTYENKEIIIIENNSEEEQTFRFYRVLEKRYPQVKVVYYKGDFNYSAINNFGARAATGDFLLLLNNDTEVISGDWLEWMAGYCQQEGVACAGAKLLYPDDTIQHAGVVIGIGGIAGHICTGAPKEDTGYMRRLVSAQAISAVTGACLMVRSEVYHQIGGLDESFAVAFNDVDFCLRVQKAGYRVVFLPDVLLHHFESKSRGYETTPEKKKRFQGEIDRFRSRYEKLLREGDPYYNPNLSLKYNNCQVRKTFENLQEEI